MHLHRLLHFAIADRKHNKGRRRRPRTPRWRTSKWPRCRRQHDMAHVWPRDGVLSLSEGATAGRAGRHCRVSDLTFNLDEDGSPSSRASSFRARRPHLICAAGGGDAAGITQPAKTPRCRTSGARCRRATAWPCLRRPGPRGRRPFHCGPPPGTARAGGADSRPGRAPPTRPRGAGGDAAAGAAGGVRRCTAAPRSSGRFADGRPRVILRCK